MGKSAVRNIMLLGTAIGAQVVLPHSARAQTVSEQPPATPDTSASDGQPEAADIVVTANKRSQTLRDVPMSITAVGGSELASKGINNVADLVKITPGLSYVESGNSVPVFSLRGVGFFDTALGARPTVSVYVDEAPLPFSIMTAGAAFDLERVEVLKGPQGTLFGQNATGGAINYIAAKPKSEPEAGVTASYARFGTFDATGYATGALTSTLNARIAVRTVQGGAWQRSYTRDDKLGDQNFTQGRFLLDWQASEKVRFALNLNGFVDKGETQAGQLIGIAATRPQSLGVVPLLTSYPVSPSNDRAADWNADQGLRRDNRFYQASLRSEIEMSDDFTLTSLTSYSDMRIRQVVDLDGTALSNALGRIKGNVSSFFQEVRITGKTGPLESIFGVNYAHDRSNEDDIFEYPYSTASQALLPTALFTATRPTGTQVFDTMAVFGNADLAVTDQITLHGGVRYTLADLDYKVCTRAANQAAADGQTALYNRLRAARGLAPIPAIAVGQCTSLDATITPAQKVGSFDQDNISWRAGVDFKPSARTLIYANVSRGYKTGSVPVTAATSLAQLGPVSQETVLAYEAGFKASLFDRLAEVNGAVFYYKYSDKQVKGRILTNPNILGPIEALVNIPRSKITGAEAQLTLRPARGLMLTAAGTYIDSKVTSDFPNYTILGTLQNFRDDAFPYTPKWQVVLDGEYRIPASSSVDVVLGANYNYRTKTRAGFGDEDALKIDSYGLLDLRAGIEAPDGKWRVQAFGRNVTNTYYWTNVAKYFDVVRRLAGQPATYGVQVGYKF
ncbi:TonB-dependent receptor [Sphingobium sp.]|uniref:TonB-dependent receptor n=2 Tax=unclassified Sphingobium TaxID=2611147 RepID=UPI002694E232